ncbi:hypothetical protein E3N88_46060 [Mikania micrantha]|uniref:Uncharacterized protein n=1 Tax=Mikania micrantha TaxID=192012 RepID=A0A5N6L7C3_9ASTR|nr:hypothetical protein E3N88_46060 [Mikania micrantha]
MNPPNPNLILYGQPTHSEKFLMISWSTDLNVGVSLNSGTTIESTESDARSAPPFDEILESITNQLIHLLESKERQLPTEWSMPDLVRAVNGEDFSILVSLPSTHRLVVTRHQTHFMKIKVAHSHSEKKGSGMRVPRYTTSKTGRKIRRLGMLAKADGPYYTKRYETLAGVLESRKDDLSHTLYCMQDNLANFPTLIASLNGWYPQLRNESIKWERALGRKIDLPNIPNQEGSHAFYKAREIQIRACLLAGAPHQIFSEMARIVYFSKGMA